MGRDVFTRSSYDDASTRFVPRSGHVTRRAEAQAHATGKLNPLVDPAGYGIIRESRPRFQLQTNGTQLMTIGCSLSLESRVDTTGSMGGNVNVAVRVLPDTYELASGQLLGYDLQVAIGIFGDVIDRFVLCRPQFEMEAAKLVEQLTLMVPERGGGDFPEDPHYGIFGAAYLTRTYDNRIGLKGYDFTISDATARDRFDDRTLRRVFGGEVYEKVEENGFVNFDPRNLPDTKEVALDLLKRAHGFFLQVEDTPQTTRFWTKIFGQERVVMLPSTEMLPQVQAVIIGLTEGTLALDQVKDFLTESGVSKGDAKLVQRSVANIPIGAQVPLRQAIIDAGHEIPKAGDVFRGKPNIFTDQNLWPMTAEELAALPEVVSDEDAAEDVEAWL